MIQENITLFIAILILGLFALLLEAVSRPIVVELPEKSTEPAKPVEYAKNDWKGFFDTKTGRPVDIDLKTRKEVFVD